MSAFLIILFGVLPASAGVFVAVRLMRDEHRLARASIVVAAMGAGAILLRLCSMLVFAPLYDWNSGKLAPLVAFWKGMPLYDDPKTGVMSDWIYGPVSALIFFPTSFCKHPTSAMILGATINLLVSLVPALWILAMFIYRGGKSARMMGVLIMCAFLGVVVRHESLQRATSLISSDGPTLGLIGCSCALLMGRRTLLKIAGSATCAVLACWSKQTVVPFLIVPVLFLFLADGGKNAVKYAALLLGIGSIISTAVLLKFNVPNMWYQMVSLVAMQHFQLQDEEHGKIVALCYGIGEWLNDVMEPASLLLLTLLFGTLAHDETAPADTEMFDPPTWLEWGRTIAQERPWIILLMPATVLIPSSILGFTKIAGYYNNFAYANLFVLLAATAGLIDVWPRVAASKPSLARITLIAASLFVFTEGITLDATKPGALATIRDHLSKPSENQQEVVYEYAKANPGIGYFPWNPLATLLAEGKLYHFEWGIVDRFEAGLTPSLQQIAGHLPEHIRFIAFPPRFQSANALKLFPEATVHTSLTELPGFLVVTDRATAEAAGVLPGASPQPLSTPLSASPNPSPGFFLPPSSFDLTPRVGGN